MWPSDHSLLVLGVPATEDDAGECAPNSELVGLELAPLVLNILNVGLSSSLVNLNRFLGGVHGSSVSLELQSCS